MAVTAPSQVPSVEPELVKSWLDEGECILVDVREPDEHASEHIPGSRLIPLSGISAAALPGSARVVLHCRAGVRSREAAAKCPGRDVCTLTGGIEAWKKAGLPTRAQVGAPCIGIMRQVQLVIGAVVLTGAALAYWVDPLWVALAAVPGAGLLMAGATGFCPMAELISRMPWNTGFKSTCCTT
jgi:rhodanese-related sulfurtransferase